MNQANFVQFKKERDLGGIITDTFKFLRLEWKPFFTTIFKISIIPILLAIAAIIFFSVSFSDLFSLALSSNDGSLGDENLGMFFVSIAFLFLFYLIAYVMVTASAMYYIRSYIENQGVIDYSYINEMTKIKFWSLSGVFILKFFIILVGAFFCFLPSIYFGVVLSLSTSLFVFSDKDPLDAIGQSFTIIKGYWWETFGVIIVVTILVVVLNYISQVPATIYQFIKMGISIESNDPTELFSLFKDPIYLILLVFSYLVRFFLYTITIISYVFIYFDINERNNATGSIEMIDTLGQN